MVLVEALFPGGDAVTKSEMLATLATDTGLKKKEIENVMQALQNLILKTLKKEFKIKLDGLGVFQLKDRKARLARNPRTGEMVQVAAKRVVKFRVVKSLKEAVLKK
jgi:DNA-binding protein HU-beta